jgi:1-acyl-sn-glycerol-3-phosphate acyltransferase
MTKGGSSASFDPCDSNDDEARLLCRRMHNIGRGITTLILDLFIIKPIAIFVWLFSHCANTVHFRERREFLDHLKRAHAERRPVVVAINHVSWFDDPVIPMTLYRTGQRASLEFIALGGFMVVCWMLQPGVISRLAAVFLWVVGATAVALFGARKVWWTLGDRVNLSDASVLRSKFALTREAPPGRLLRSMLGLADAAIPWFMRSGSTKTIFVDRRPGEEAKLSRDRAVAAALEIAEGLEPVWVFFEGGRSKVPGVIAPARRGVGSLVLGLRERGHQPLVVVVYHRGMECLIPPGGSRFLSYGHQVEVHWSLLDADLLSVEGIDAQAVANAVREAAVRLQASGPVIREIRA